MVNDKEAGKENGAAYGTIQGDKGRNIKSDKGDGKCEAADLNIGRVKGKKHLKKQRNKIKGNESL